MRFSKMAVVSVISTAALLATAGIASATTSVGQGQAVQKPGFNYRMMGHNGGRGIGFGGPMGSVMSAVAKDLNISTQTLATDLASGKSIKDLATTQGVSTTTLTQDVQTAMTADLNQAVQAGKITSAQASTMESNLAQRVQDFLSQTHQARGPKGIGLGGPMGSVMSAVAKDLNISTQTLATDLASGKSINDLATTQGVSTTTLTQTVQAAMTADLNQAVQAGKITSAQASTMESNLAQRVQDFLSQTHQARGPKGIGLGGPMDSVMSAVAKDLNISTQTLATDLASGKSIKDLATTQGVSTTTLTQDVQTAMTADLNQAVQAGKITSAQASTMESNLAQRVQDFLSQTHQARGPKGIGLGGPMGSVMSAVAKDLNISTQTLATDLASGKSINDLATTQGVSTTTLAQTVQAAMTADLNQAVQAGKITSAQASTMESNLSQRVQNILSQSRAGGPRGPRGSRGVQGGAFRGM